MRDELLNRLLACICTEERDVSDLKMKFVMILNDYEITGRETELVVFEGDKNRRLVQGFLMSKTVAGCSQRTIEQYASVYKILEKIGKNAEEVTSDDVKVYMAGRMIRDRISKKTADNERRYLSSFFRYLQVEEIILKNPMMKVEKIRQEKVRKKAFSDIEVEKIRSSCKDAREKAIVEVLFSTGCRVTELVNIKTEDICGSRIVVHGKGGKDRNVYLNAKAQIAVEAYLKERRDKNVFLFAAGIYMAFGKGRCSINRTKKSWWRYEENVGDGHVSAGSIESTCRKIGRNAGVENVHPHRFRRTCATLALRRGMPLEQVSRMLGHEELTTTQIYLDLSEKDLEQAHSKYVI